MVAIVLAEKASPGYGFKYGLEKKVVPIEEVKSDETLLKMQGAALNHRYRTMSRPPTKKRNVLFSPYTFTIRDVWILKGQYAGIGPGATVCSDGVGIVVKSSEFKPGQRVLINPGYNWDADERGPERSFGILGLAPYPGS